jgi:hypothetical protein
MAASALAVSGQLSKALRPWEQPGSVLASPVRWRHYPGPGRHPRALKASGEHRPENDRDFAIYYRDSHARHGILTSRSLDLAGDRRAAFPTALVGNQIDSVLRRGREHIWR